MPHVVEARYVTAYTVWLRFSDGIEGEVDLATQIWGEVFEPLKDPTYFRSFVVHPELGTVTWPNGADFSPEFLHSQVTVRA